MNSRLRLAILIYLIIIAFIIYINPKTLHKNGKLTEFGVGKGKTIFPFWFLIFMAAFISFYVSQIFIFTTLSQ